MRAVSVSGWCCFKDFNRLTPSPGACVVFPVSNRSRSLRPLFLFAWCLRSLLVTKSFYFCVFPICTFMYLRTFPLYTFMYLYVFLILSLFLILYRPDVLALVCMVLYIPGRAFLLPGSCLFRAARSCPGSLPACPALSRIFQQILSLLRPIIPTPIYRYIPCFRLFPLLSDFENTGTI